MGCLTIYTDASYSTSTKVAGYGFWARDRQYIASGYGAESGIRCNTMAEIRAVAYALWYLETRHLESVKDKLYCTVTTDCQSVIDYYLHKKAHDIFGDKPYKYVRELMTRYEIKFNIKWVKGHSMKDGARSFVNRKVDSLARKGRELKEKNIVCRV